MKDLKFDFKKGILTKNRTPLLIEGNNVYAQNIKIEAITTEGDLWHNVNYGWSLVDFMHRQLNDMLKIEIEQRIKDKLSNRSYVEQDSIKIRLEEEDDKLLVHIDFYINTDEIDFTVALNRVNGEVNIVE